MAAGRIAPLSVFGIVSLSASAKAAVGTRHSTIHKVSRMLSIRFFIGFLLLFVSVGLARPTFFLIFFVSEPNAQRDNRCRRCKGNEGHRHMVVRVLPQQYRAEAASNGCFRALFA